MAPSLPRRSYATWRSDFFTAAEITAGLGEPLADPDGDRLANLIEFVTKSNPRRASKSPVKISFPAAGKVRFSYERRADLVAADYQISLGVSASLTAWPTVPPSATLPTDNATVELIHDLDLPAAGRFFGRLRAAPGTP